VGRTGARGVFGSRDSEGRSIAEVAGNGTKGGTNDEAAALVTLSLFNPDVMPSVLSSTEFCPARF